MAQFFWDASALTKRYAPEVGSDTVNALFSGSLAPAMLSTPWGYLEAYSALLRRRNRGTLDLAAFTAAVSALQIETADTRRFRLLSIDDTHIFASTVAVRRHNLNATDAALLTMLLEYTVAAPADGPLVVVAADQRLLRAAAAEGLRTLNPETLLAADVPPFLAGL
jgi:predicted nucleic acid-binding protein